MIQFGNIDNFKSPETEFRIIVEQRILPNDISFLRSDRQNDLAHTFDSNLTPTSSRSLPYIEIERLNRTRDQLIEKRTKLLDSWFLFVRPYKKRKIEIIENQLDIIETQIIALQKDSRDHESAYIEKFISDNEKLIQQYNSNRNSLG